MFWLFIWCVFWWYVGAIVAWHTARRCLKPHYKNTALDKVWLVSVCVGVVVFFPILVFWLEGELVWRDIKRIRSRAY